MPPQDIIDSCHPCMYYCVFAPNTLILTTTCQSAWAVNFSIPLKSFVDEHIKGIFNLIQLANSCSKVVEFTFCSSTASVLGTQKAELIPETTSQQPSDAQKLGYSQSKWVADSICAAAAPHFSGRINVIRVGQLTGDTENGIWNVSEAFPLILMAVDALDALPMLEDEPLKWVPFDKAAAVILELSIHSNDVEAGENNFNVFNLTNNRTDMNWKDMMRIIKEVRSKPFNVVTWKEWLDLVEQYDGQLPAKNLLGFWRASLASAVKGCNDTEGTGPEKTHESVFAVEKAEQASETMRSLSTYISDGLIKKIWHWVEEEMSGAKVKVYVSRNRFDTKSTT